MWDEGGVAGGGTKGGEAEAPPEEAREKIGDLEQREKRR